MDLDARPILYCADGQPAEPQSSRTRRGVFPATADSRSTEGEGKARAARCPRRDKRPDKLPPRINKRPGWAGFHRPLDVARRSPDCGTGSFSSPPNGHCRRGKRRNRPKIAGPEKWPLGRETGTRLHPSVRLSTSGAVSFGSASPPTPTLRHSRSEFALGLGNPELGEWVPPPPRSVSLALRAPVLGWSS